MPLRRPSEAAGGRRASSWAILAYAMLGAFGAFGAIATGHDPFTTRAWLPFEGFFASSLSILLGFGVAALTIAATRTMVARAAWARELHGDLRSVVQGADDAAIVVSAIASGVAEELFFRGLLVPVVGVWVSSIAFGLVHQVRGRARWAWAVWAGIMGLVFAAVFELTGHLEGAIVAHVVINTANLRFLRDSRLGVVAVSGRPRRVGGLLD
jgi:membrane protease YdiL (CAAX protease family)